MTLRNDYSDAQKDNCRPFRKTQNSFTLSFVALALLRHNSIATHSSFPDPAGRPRSGLTAGFQMSLQVVGLPDWPVSARFLPSPPSPAAHQPRNHSSSDLYAAHSRQAVTAAKSTLHESGMPNLNGAKPSLLQPIFWLTMIWECWELNANPGEHVLQGEENAWAPVKNLEPPHPVCSASPSLC